MRYGYFESELTGYNEDGLPIFDRAENDEFFTRLWRYLIKNGVMSEPADTFMVQASNGMEVTVKKGFAVIQGKFAYGDRVETLTIEPASQIYPRIDAVVIRLDYVNRNIVVVNKTGIPSANPKMPELERTEDGLYELCLATIRVEANATEIRSGNITDRRSDGTYCGLIEAIGNVADDKVKVVVPTQKGTLIYTGDELTPSWSGYDESIMDISGDTSGYEPGTYVTRFILKDGYIWSDGSPLQKEVEWTIEKKPILSPILDTYNFEYDGNQKTVNVYNYDPSVMTKSGSESDSKAGSYPIYFSLLDPVHHKWTSTGSSDMLTLKWSIGIVATAPSLVEKTLTYNGAEQQPALTTYDSSKVNVAITPKTNAGKYTVTLSLVDPSVMLWEDGSKDNIDLEWTIAKRALTKPTLKSSPVYSGSSVSPALNNFDTTYESITGNTGTDAGNYKAVISLTDTVNTEWSDGTSNPVNINWEVQVLKLPVPTVSANPTFSGSAVSPTLTNFNSTWENISGNSKTDAGSYVATVSLKDPVNTKWNDGSNTNKTVNWEVLKKSLAIPTASGNTYNGNQQTATLSNFQSSWMTLTCEPKVVVGSYTCKVSLNNPASTSWSDGSVSDKTISWSINQKPITVPTYSGSSTSAPEYSGSEIDLTLTSYLENYDSSYMEVSGNKQTVAGSYTATFTLKDKVNCRWNKNDQNDVSISWTIKQKVVLAPVLKGSTNTGQSYTGKLFDILAARSDTAQIYLQYYDSSVMTTDVAGSVLTATDVGSYTTYFRLKDTKNYKWQTGDGVKTVTWKIVRTSVGYTGYRYQNGDWKEVSYSTQVTLSPYNTTEKFKIVPSIDVATVDQTLGFFADANNTSSSVYKAVSYTFEDNILTITRKSDAPTGTTTIDVTIWMASDENMSGGNKIMVTLKVTS